MKTNKGREFSDLKTRTVTVKLVDGDYECGVHYQNIVKSKDGLRSCRKFTPYDENARVANVAAVVRCPNINAVLFLSYYGQIYKWTNVKDGKSLQYSGIVGNFKPEAVQCVVNNNPAVAVVSGARLTYIFTDSYENYVINFRLYGVCGHRSRLFGADGDDKTLLRWSAEDFKDWTVKDGGGGYLKLKPDKGDIIKAVSYKDELVVVRRYGLDLIKTVDPRYFSVDGRSDALYTSAILEDSVTEFGGKIYFCSEDFIFCYDGDGIKRVDIPENMRPSGYCHATNCEGRYLIYRCLLRDGVNKGFIIYDAVNGDWIVMKSIFEFIWYDGTAFFAWFSGSTYRYEGELNNFIWKSKPINLGTKRNKLLKCIRCERDGVYIRVTCGDFVKTFYLDRGNLIDVGMIGREFVFTLDGTGSVSKLEADFEVSV